MTKTTVRLAGATGMLGTASPSTCSSVTTSIYGCSSATEPQTPRTVAVNG